MTAALELLRRRCPNPPANRAERDRALGILVRRGYPPELAFDALRRHAGAEAEPDDF
jgi:SOS response regulatory protein OraA/RecX